MDSDDGEEKDPKTATDKERDSDKDSRSPL